MVSLFRDWVLALIVSLVVLLDQFTKYLVRVNLDLGESWPTQGLLRLTHGTNSGSAFGLFPDQTAILTVASIVAIGFLFYIYKTYALTSLLLRFAVGLQLGGAFGNLIDRLRNGVVVDFIDFGWWPVFNIADSSIVVGITILAGVLLFDRSKRSLISGPKDDNSLEGSLQ